MLECRVLDRLELTRKKFARPVQNEEHVMKNMTNFEDEWDGVHCPMCGGELRHESGCVICSCGWSKC